MATVMLFGQSMDSWEDFRKWCVTLIGTGAHPRDIAVSVQPVRKTLEKAWGPVTLQSISSILDLAGPPTSTTSPLAPSPLTGYLAIGPKKTKKEKETTMDTWATIDAVMGVSQRILLRGLPGTGKTYAATKRGLRPGQKVYSVTMTPETPAAEFRGHFVPKGGEMVWMDGPGIRGWREAARLVINEIDQASPDCLSLMFAILDDPEFAEFTLPTGETVHPEQGFQVVATMNGEPEDLPVALQDRFPVSILIEEPNPEAIATLPEDLRGPARNTLLVENPDRRVSIRAWAEFANLRNKLDKVTAAKAIFGHRYQDALDAMAVNEVDL